MAYIPKGCDQQGRLPTGKRLTEAELDKTIARDQLLEKHWADYVPPMTSSDREALVLILVLSVLFVLGLIWWGFTWWRK